MSDDKKPTLGMQTGISVALVAVLLAGTFSYGRQSQRLDSIEVALSENRVELREMRREMLSLRELLIQRTTTQPKETPR